MKKMVTGLLAAAFVMLALPWIAVTFVRGDAGMAACFVLFFAVDPLCSVLLGVRAGGDPKKLWPLPVASALLFLAGVWLLFDPGEKVFLLYAAVYLLLGLAAMLIAALAGRKSAGKGD
jgi:peptidoglycan/LPS O-acetylase OafA/YrhL